MTAATADWLTTDFYAVLGVPPTASAKDVARAYRSLARELHPDTRTGRDGDERFAQVTAAYEVLGDPGKRRAYDRLRAAPANRRRGSGSRPGGVRVTVQQPGRGFDGIADLGDVPGGTRGDDLLGSGLGGRSARWRRAPRRGGDLQAVLPLSFESAVRGETLDLPLTETLPCDGCRGAGRAAGAGAPCAVCQGAGLRRRTRTVTARIPPGVRDGQTVRLAGLGDPGTDGGPPGDLLVEVEVAPHPLLGRDGRHLTATVPVTFAEAALGADIAVPTLEGPVTVRVPAGTASGTTLRVRGRGVPAHGGRQAGDLLVTVHVDVPSDLTEAQRAAVEALAAATTTSPRAHLGV